MIGVIEGTLTKQELMNTQDHNLRITFRKKLQLIGLLIRQWIEFVRPVKNKFSATKYCIKSRAL
ncbi:MAG: hypothetical protein WCJ95_18250 [Mariniphaga sp.]